MCGGVYIGMSYGFVGGGDSGYLIIYRKQFFPLAFLEICQGFLPIFFFFFFVTQESNFVHIPCSMPISTCLQSHDQWHLISGESSKEAKEFFVFFFLTPYTMESYLWDPREQLLFQPSISNIPIMF